MMAKNISGVSRAVLSLKAHQIQVAKLALNTLTQTLTGRRPQTIILKKLMIYNSIGNRPWEAHIRFAEGGLTYSKNVMLMQRKKIGALNVLVNTIYIITITMKDGNVKIVLVSFLIKQMLNAQKLMAKFWKMINVNVKNGNVKLLMVIIMILIN